MQLTLSHVLESTDASMLISEFELTTQSIQNRERDPYTIHHGVFES